MAQEKQQTKQEDGNQQGLTRHKIKKSLVYLGIAVLLIIIIIFVISAIHTSSYPGKIKIDDVCRNLQKDIVEEGSLADTHGLEKGGDMYYPLENKIGEMFEIYLVDDVKYVGGKTLSWTKSNGFFSGPSEVLCDVQFKFCVNDICNDAWHTQMSINWEEYQEWHSQK